MEKNITLNTPLTGNYVADALRKNIITDYVKNCLDTMSLIARLPLEWLGNYYSKILEHKVSHEQTMLLLKTQVAFVLSILPANIPFLLRIVFLVMFACFLLKCKKEF